MTNQINYWAGFGASAGGAGALVAAGVGDVAVVTTAAGAALQPPVLQPVVTMLEPQVLQPVETGAAAVQVLQVLQVGAGAAQLVQAGAAQQVRTR